MAELHITAAREATDAQCLLPVCSEDREQLAQPFAGTSPAHPAVTLCGKVPLVVQHGVVAKIQCPEPPARNSHTVQLPGERSAADASRRSLSFGRSFRSPTASEDLGERRSRSLPRSASAGSTLRQARQIAGMLATEGARGAQGEGDQRVVRLSSGAPSPRSPRSVSATQVVGVTQNYMQRRNSFGKYTSSPTSDRSPRSSFGQSSDAGSEAAKHSEGMRLAVASALATVLPDVIAAEALGEGRRLGARETAQMASNPQMMAHALELLHDELGEPQPYP